MNKTASEAVTLVEQFLARAPKTSRVDTVLAPPFTALAAVAAILAPRAPHLSLGAQDVFWEDRGAYTGEISAPMLADLGCRYVLVGHSERRHLFGESDEAVAKKVQALLRHGLQPILCVGETRQERQRKETERVVTRQILNGLAGLSADQMARLTIAYEPVWAIGTGEAATPEQAATVHRQIRSVLAGEWSPACAAAVRILYGGSVTATNVGEFLASPEVNGALVGGACLDPAAFATIVSIADATT